ncbi:MAG: tRNA (adenosine(37)-N6)-dimethylallyltransferase MiaA [Bryobacteraceae bacterium]
MDATSPLLVIVGPTGSGKSDLAIRLALDLNGEIVNCDSLQIYRHFNIGTAKVPPAERHGIPHHMMDIAEPDEVFTAGDYARLARPILREIAGRGKLPIVVGGTGFYLKALLEGLFSGPQRDEALRMRLVERETRRSGSLHRLLSRFDAEGAARIHPRDVQKLTRAVEICLLARRTLTELFGEGRDPLTGFSIVKVGLDPDRGELYARLNERCRRMFEAGLVDEVRGILAMGYSPESKPFESIGYHQTIKYLRGEKTIEEAIADTQQETRRYAKRQWTWFRRDPAIRWFKNSKNSGQAGIIEFLSATLPT